MENKNCDRCGKKLGTEAHDVHTCTPKEIQPVAWLKELPSGTTHISSIEPVTNSGGIQRARFYTFKYEDNCLLVYVTDNDNEYAQWESAHKKFNKIPDIYSIYTTPLKKEWVGLTNEEIEEGQKQSWANKQAFESAVWWAEAKLKEKNSD